MPGQYDRDLVRAAYDGIVTLTGFEACYHDEHSTFSNTTSGEPLIKMVMYWLFLFNAVETGQRIHISIRVAESDKCSVSNPYGKHNDFLGCKVALAIYFDTADI